MATLEDDVDQAVAACRRALRSRRGPQAQAWPSYKQLPEPIDASIHELRQRHGELALAPFYRALLRSLPEDSAHLLAHSTHAFTDEIERLRLRSLQRIQAQYGARDDADFKLDICLKDIAICNGTLFPAGARVVEISPGFPRNLIIRSGFSQACRFVNLLSGMGGNGPCYQLHVHLSELQEFNPAGWQRTLARLASMLRLNTGIRGVFASAWFYDPAIAKVSPKLAYLRETALQTGAREFLWGPDKSNNALVRSESRKRMFETGQYQPQVYYLIWPRKSLIAASHKT